MFNKCRIKGRKEREMRNKRHQFGGATLEYILVSTFATILTVAALTYLAGVFRERLDMLSSKLGIEIEFEELDFLDKNSQ